MFMTQDEDEDVWVPPHLLVIEGAKVAEVANTSDISASAFSTFDLFTFHLVKCFTHSYICFV